MTRNKNSIPMFNVKHDRFKNSFFSSTIIEWNNVDSESGDFQETYIGFHKTYANWTFHCHCPDGLKLITRLRLCLSHGRFHKFKHNFQDTSNPICCCGTVETTFHYFLHCPNFSNERLIFFNKLQRQLQHFSKCFSMVMIHLMM